MKSKNSFLKTDTRQIIGFLVLAVFAFSVILPTLVKAQQLRFNWMPGDYETLTLKNITKGTLEEADAINADAGDEVSFFVHYHCGWDDPAWPEEKAQDTTVRIDFPVNRQNEINTLAQVWATNVPAATDAGRINASSAQTLTFKNTAKWYHDTIEEDISTTIDQGYTEVNIGDVACDCTGCYNSQGFVEFKAQLSEIQPPTVDIKANGSDGPITISYGSSATLSWTSSNASSCVASGDWSGSRGLSGSEPTGSLTISKTYTIACTGPGGTAQDSVRVNVEGGFPGLTISKLGRNLTQGQTYFQDVVSANPSDKIEFKIEIASTGTGVANNVTVKDILPSLVYYEGNLRVDGVPTVGDIFSGLSLGILAQGQSKNVTFEARLASEGNFGYGTTSLVNNAQTWADGVSQRIDTATVNVYRSSPPPSSPGLSIDKLVKNITDSTAWLNSVSADPLDRIEFRIQITSVGDATATNVIVEDILPDKITYQGNLKINGILAGGNILGGINLGSLASGQSKTITFEAKIASETNFVYGTTTLVNQASVRADGIGEIYDSATLSVTRISPSQALLSITKKVRNQTKGQTSWYEIITAKPSEKIAFKIVVTSTGSTKAYDVIVKDDLPDKIAWHGNLEIDGQNSSGDITTGIDIGDLSPGQSKTISFETLLASKENFSFGSTELINTAMAYNVDIAVTDTAKLTVTRTAVAGAVTEVPTGVLSSAKISLFITILLALVVSYFLLLKSFVSRKMEGFRFNEMISETKEKTKDALLSIYFSPEERSEKKLSKLIAEIKKREGLE